SSQFLLLLLRRLLSDFASFLEFVYTAKVQVEEDRVQRMLEMAEKLKCLDLSETCFQLKKQMLESVLLELQNFSESQEAEGSSGAQVTAALAPEAWAGMAPDGPLANGVASSLDPPAERIGNGLLPDLPPRKSREKPDKRKEVAKPPYPKLRRASGRLAGRKVFVEIPKKKYTRRLREQQKSVEQDMGGCGGPREPSPEALENEKEAVTKDEEDSGAGAGVEAAPPKVGRVEEGDEEEEEGEEGPGRRRSNFQCTRCEKAFLYEKSFLKHVRLHHGVATEVVHRCDTCGQTFANRCNLKGHQRHVHSSERHFPCELCGKKFKRKKDVKRHVVQVHEGGGERHQCQQCGKGLSSKTALRLHERRHRHKPHGCPSARPPSRRGDEEEEEGEEGPGRRRSNFQCTRCEKAFLYEKSFLKHVRLHHGVATEVVHRCDTCGQTFANRCNLKGHQRHAQQRAPLPVRAVRQEVQEEEGREAARGAGARGRRRAAPVPAVRQGPELQDGAAAARAHAHRPQALRLLRVPGHLLAALSPQDPPEVGLGWAWRRGRLAWSPLPGGVTVRLLLLEVGGCFHCLGSPWRQMRGWRFLGGAWADGDPSLPFRLRGLSPPLTDPHHPC
uniref:C2H2-type domain-containing protein n=1 Tax=Bos mutus grunniens TaxID=30521 RepID=A0A8B9WY10_BOSMU